MNTFAKAGVMTTVTNNDYKKICPGCIRLDQVYLVLSQDIGPGIGVLQIFHKKIAKQTLPNR